jgi:hypothetical protein
MLRRRRLGLVVLLGAAALAAACFSPREPACAFSCATDGKCPPSYSCRPDGFCHRDDDAGVCLLGDGGAD